MLSDPGSRNKPHIRHAIEHMYADVYALDAINWSVLMYTSRYILPIL